MNRRRTRELLLVVLAGTMAVSCRGRTKEAYFARGNQYFASKKYNEAIVEYRNAIKKDPQYAAARAQLAEAYMRINDPKDATFEYVAAADLQPQDADAQLKAASILLLGKQYEAARARTLNVLRNEPRNVPAQV